MSELSIAKAAAQALGLIGKPAKPAEIYQKIIERGYYQFHTEKPVTAVRIAIERQCEATERTDKRGAVLFTKVAPGTFALLGGFNHKAGVSPAAMITVVRKSRLRRLT